MPITGKCLCKAVQYKADGPVVFSGNCYCEDCRHESGAAHVTFGAVPLTTLTVTGETAEYTKPVEDGRTVRQVFCPSCGSTLFGCMSVEPSLALLRAGTLDDPSCVTPQANLFVGRAPDWDQPVSGLYDFPGMAPAA